MKAHALSFPKFNLFEKKYLASRIASAVFIVVCILYLWGGQPFAATLTAVVAIALFAIQFVFQFKWVNCFLGGMMFLASIYLSLAVWSEFAEFEVVNNSALQLLLVGWSLCLTGIVLSVFMMVDFIRSFVK